MNTLCFMSNLTSDEWASWVQAVGSVLAILAATLIAILQIKKQHSNDLKLQEIDQLNSQLDITKTIDVLASTSLDAMSVVQDELKDLVSFEKVAEGREVCFIGEVSRIDSYMANIPIHTLPYSMVTSTMMLGSVVRQFKDVVESSLENYRLMNGDSVNSVIDAMNKMSTHAKQICGDIRNEVERLEILINNKNIT